MVCPYCGYEKNKDSDTVCQSCNRRIKYDMTYSPVVKKQKVYRSGITRTELLADWSKLSLQEYYKRFCPVKIGRKIESAMLGMWAGVFSLVVWFLYEFLNAYGVDFKGMWGCEISGLYRLLIEVWLLVCIGSYIKCLLNMKQKFYMTPCYVSIALMIFICFYVDLKETYMMLFLPPFIACIVLTRYIFDLTDAWRKKKLERDVYQEQNPMLDKESHVLSMQEYVTNLCPETIKRDLKLAVFGVWIGAVCIFAGFLYDVVQMWIESGTKYDGPYFERFQEADVFFFLLVAAASVFLYIRYLGYAMKTYRAGFFWMLLLTQLLYLYEVTGVQTVMLCWIVPAAAVFFLQISMRRVTRLYDAEVLQERIEEQRMM